MTHKSADECGTQAEAPNMQAAFEDIGQTENEA